jgi:hypothetical protein
LGFPKPPPEELGLWTTGALEFVGVVVAVPVAVVPPDPDGSVAPDDTVVRVLFEEPATAPV